MSEDERVSQMQENAHCPSPENLSFLAFCLSMNSLCECQGPGRSSSGSEGQCCPGPNCTRPQFNQDQGCVRKTGQKLHCNEIVYKVPALEVRLHSSERNLACIIYDEVKKSTVTWTSFWAYQKTRKAFEFNCCVFLKPCFHKVIQFGQFEYGMLLEVSHHQKGYKLSLTRVPYTYPVDP